MSSLDDINQMLEQETKKNKGDTWNKLDNSLKTQKLHKFAEKYGKDHNFPAKDTKALKAFLKQLVDSNKLKKVKDVIISKDTNDIESIPGLFYNNSTKEFTLRNLEKRVSTIKSLTPKRNTIVNIDAFIPVKI